jgi:hypothetical protein
MIDKIRRLFLNKNVDVESDNDTAILVSNPEFKTEYNDWKLISDGNIPHEVILAAVDSYDCGWVMDTVYRNDGDDTWYLSGSVDVMEAYMCYTHWRKLPEPPIFN